MSKRTVQARVTIHGWSEMERGTRKIVVRWLRRCATALEAHPKDYGRRPVFRLVDVEF